MWGCLRLLLWWWIMSSETFQVCEAHTWSLMGRWAIESSWLPCEGKAFIPEHLRIHITVMSFLPRRLDSGSGRNGPLMGLFASFLGYVRSTGKSIWVPDSSSILPPTFWRSSLRNSAIKMCAELRCYEFADEVGMGQVHSFLIWGRPLPFTMPKGRTAASFCFQKGNQWDN